jgi:anaerobic magnesium-protoporphyrin IX monomethyl ester cyclase
MRILFVNSHAFYSEPLGTMQLSAICKEMGHETRLSVLTRKSIAEDLEAFQPDLIGYSVMTPNEHLFAKADQAVKAYSKRKGQKVVRIMGGPHPTYFPEVLDKFDLDAICLGDGDNAIKRIIERMEKNENFDDIPNVATKEQPEFEKEVISDLDTLPPLDRKVFYDAAPDLQHVGLRGFITQRGCPYKCTYCFNHAFNLMFKGDGRKLLRRRSVDHLFKEIKQVQRDHGPLRYLRFGDDVFVIRKDAWLEEFVERYPREIGIPFYCLIRASGLDDEVAEMLARAGCKSVGMSIEAGSERLRNDVLKRNMPEKLMIDSFNAARRNGIVAHANSMMGLPGSTLEDDFETFLFAKKLRAAAPTFSIFCPFPKTELTQLALDKGVLPQNFDYNNTYRNASVLTNYTDEERREQLHLAYLAGIFCLLPNFMIPLLRVMVKLPFTGLYSHMEAFSEAYLRGMRIFPGAQPLNPLAFARAVKNAVGYILQAGKSKTEKEDDFDTENPNANPGSQFPII